MAPVRSTPIGGGGGAATPLSGLRARPVADGGDASELRGSVGGSGAGPSLSDALEALDAMAPEIENDRAALLKTNGELADDMIAVQKFRCDTVASLAEVARELVEAVEEAQRRSGDGVVGRDEHERRLKNVEKVKQSVVTDIDAGRERIEKLKSFGDKILQEDKENQENEARRKQMVGETALVLEKTLKFYETLSQAKLFWKPDSSSGGVLSGFVVSPEGPLPFSFDYSVTSRYDAVNELWTMI